MDVLREIGNYGLLPSAAPMEKEQALALAQALEQAGLPVLEILLRGEKGLACIRAIHAEKPEFLLGAGMVQTAEQCRKAVEAGAAYITTPQFSEELAGCCAELGVPLIPVCVTPGEIAQALRHGIRAAKFAPAEAYGADAGCEALYASCAADGLQVIPAGNISEEMLTAYAGKPYVLAVQRQWPVPETDAAEEEWKQITRLAHDAIDRMLGFELAHVGVNLEDACEAERVSEQFERFFGWHARNGAASIFADTWVEILKSRGRGDMGHLAIRTYSIDRALHYLEKRGMHADTASIRYQNGHARFAYMQEQIGGFAVHLLLK